MLKGISYQGSLREGLSETFGGKGKFALDWLLPVSPVWEDEEAYATENTVMVHIRHIREKIELNPKEPEYLKVVWGIGYKMEKK